MSNTRSLCGTLVQFLRSIAIISENQINACPILVLSRVSVGLPVAMTSCTNPKLQVAHELEYQVVRSAETADGEIELRVPEEKLVELSSRTPRLRSLTDGDTVDTSQKIETARVHGVRCRVVLTEVRRGSDRISDKSRC